MPCSEVSRYKRITAGIIGILMFFIMLLSAFFIAAEVGHDCTGEDCPVCACIRQCENTLRNMGDGMAPRAVSIIPVVFILVFSSFFFWVF
ncbi:MAG: hypothetical protein K5929_07330 [Lachnospiraceae bacterium]|nr:hypothetical protein [Lachnospiraceae bacterium]